MAGSPDGVLGMPLSTKHVSMLPFFKSGLYACIISVFNWGDLFPYPSKRRVRAISRSVQRTAI